MPICSLPGRKISWSIRMLVIVSMIVLVVVGKASMRGNRSMRTGWDKGKPAWRKARSISSEQ